MNDVHFNPDRRALTFRAKQLVKEALSRITNHESNIGSRTLKRRPSEQKAFEESIESMISDVAYHYLLNRETRIAITRSKKDLEIKSRYKPSFYRRNFISDMDYLLSPEMNYLESIKGCRQFRLRTTIWAGAELVEQLKLRNIGLSDFSTSPRAEIICLRGPKEKKGKKREKIDYEDTAQTDRFRSDLECINQWMATSDIYLDYHSCQPNKHGRLPDPSLIFYHRNFTNRSFDSGGRLSGPFWHYLRKTDRRQHLRLNGEPTMEVDFTSMGVSQAYALKRLKAPEKAYEINDWPRDSLKIITNALLFHQRHSKTTGKLLPLSRWPGSDPSKKSRKKLSDDFGGLKFPTVRQAILEKHEPIADLFERGLGHQLQRQESDIIVDVLLECRRRDLVALAIHDCVVVPQSRAKEADEIMKLVYRRHTGQEGRTDFK